MSLIGYGTRTISTALSGTGAAWLNDDGADTLFDNKPQSVARLQWLTQGSPDIHDIGDYVEIQHTWGTGIAPRLISMLGLTVAANVKVEVRGRLVSGGGFTADLGGNSQARRTATMPDGTVAAHFVLGDGLASCNGVAIRIYNDLGGITWATSSSTTDIGEIVIQEAVDVPAAEFEWEWVDPTIERETLTSQLDIVPRTPYRRARLSLAPSADADHYAGGLANGMDLQRLGFELTRGRFAIVIPRWKNAAGALDNDVIDRHAVFCRAKAGPTRHITRAYSQLSGIDLREVPAA